jgi:hypothetical protein
MKQGMNESYEKGVANHSAPSFALGTAAASPPYGLTPISKGETMSIQRHFNEEKKTVVLTYAGHQITPELNVNDPKQILGKLRW